MNLQWFPGHMTKTRRMMEENIKLIDVVVELVDARIPLSSRNPEIDAIVKDKPRLLVLNKSDMSDAELNKEWIKYFKSKGIEAITVCSVGGKNFKIIAEKCRELLKDKIAKDKERGIVNRPVKIMVAGVPNVGKSSLINNLSGKKTAKTGDRPGVTTGKQWIRLESGFELLDTPGILWPKFEDANVGLKLAYTGAIKDGIMDIEELACHLLLFLRNKYPKALEQRYKMTETENLDGYDLLQLLGKKRGFVVSGGEIDTLRAASVLLDEFRGAKLGTITLESPEEYK